MSLWPGIKNIFEQTDRNGDKLKFKCLLCVPKIHFIKASVTSASNLRTHIKVRQIF